MNFKSRHIISVRDYKKEELEYLLKIAFEVKSNNYPNALKNIVLATLFFEPSTRTRLSFEAAVTLMGGSCFGFADPLNSSVQKGETLKDTIKTVSGYCNAIVIRHPLEGSARAASEVSKVPVINAGDGSNQHPTQTILDLFTIKEQFGKIDGLNICLLGDLKYGRTVHSLSMALGYYNVKLHLISPESLKIPKLYSDFLENKGIKFIETEDLLANGKDYDIIYVTRIQRERFVDPQEYEKVAGSYKINLELLDKLNKNVKIMHPLPRVDEIDSSIDETPNAIYFEQAHNGIPVRQAILSLITGAIQ